MKITATPLLLFCVVAFSNNAIADGFSSFTKAKKALYSKVYDGQGSTFYTGCDWSITRGNKKVVDLESCSLQDSFPKNKMKRAKRVEAEHVIPASHHYRRNGQWRTCAIKAKELGESKRKYCQRHDAEYKRMHNDLVNLRPAIGSINGDRSAKAFAEQPSGKNKITYRGNGKQITLTSRVAIPPKSIRGDIARIAFYMVDTYGLTLNKRQRTLYEKWNLQDPVSNEELSLNNRINRVQGWSNHYVK